MIHRRIYNLVTLLLVVSISILIIVVPAYTIGHNVSITSLPTLYRLNSDEIVISFSNKTQSMLPTISNSDIVVCKYVPFDNLKKGDIIVFKLSKIEQRLVYPQGTTEMCHRIAFKGKNFVITKGDNNEFIDGITTRDEYICKVVGKLET